MTIRYHRGTSACAAIITLCFMGFANAAGPDCACPSYGPIPAYGPSCAAPSSCDGSCIARSERPCECEKDRCCRPRCCRIRMPRFCCLPDAPYAAVSASMPAAMTFQPTLMPFAVPTSAVNFAAPRAAAAPEDEDTDCRNLRRDVDRLRSDVDELAKTTDKLASVLERIEKKMEKAGD
jgi:hypothetical protein